MTSPDVIAGDGEEKALELKEAVPESVEVSGQKSVSLLSDEELRIRVGELLGATWGHPVFNHDSKWHVQFGNPPFEFDSSRAGAAPPFKGCMKDIDVPDYCHDLNAMHEATSKMLTGQAIQFVQHVSILLGRDANLVSAWEAHCTHSYKKTCHSIFGFMNATARQRAEAFILTMTRSADSVPDLTKSDSASIKNSGDGEQGEALQEEDAATLDSLTFRKGLSDCHYIILGGEYADQDQADLLIDITDSSGGRVAKLIWNAIQSRAPSSTVTGAQGKDAASILDAITYAAHELQKCSPLSSAITALDEARKALEEKEASADNVESVLQKARSVKLVTKWVALTDIMRGHWTTEAMPHVQAMEAEIVQLHDKLFYSTSVLPRDSSDATGVQPLEEKGA